MTVGSQDLKNEESEEDIYGRLKLAEEQQVDGFKFDPEDPTYYLPEGFCLPPKVYENLFEH